MITGVILAGGDNRRMGGRVKALLPFHGETLIARQIEHMQMLCAEIIVVTNNAPLFTPIMQPSVRMIADTYPGLGPLAGMHAALTEAAHSDAWVVASDMPFISAKAARVMWELKKEYRCKAVIPQDGARNHPLHGIYDQDCAPIIHELLLARELRVMGLLDRIQWQAASTAFFLEMGVQPGFTTNMNTPEDYAQALNKLGMSSE